MTDRHWAPIEWEWEYNHLNSCQLRFCSSDQQKLEAELKRSSTKNTEASLSLSLSLSLLVPVCIQVFLSHIQTIGAFALMLVAPLSLSLPLSLPLSLWYFLHGKLFQFSSCRLIQAKNIAMPNFALRHRRRCRFLYIFFPHLTCAKFVSVLSMSSGL